MNVSLVVGDWWEETLNKQEHYMRKINNGEYPMGGNVVYKDYNLADEEQAMFGETLDILEDMAYHPADFVYIEPKIAAPVEVKKEQPPVKPSEGSVTRRFRL